MIYTHRCMREGNIFVNIHDDLHTGNQRHATTRRCLKVILLENIQDDLHTETPHRAITA